MRPSSRVMREQQRVSVWPYVEWLTSNVEGYRFTARNKGVGPALVKRVEMRLDGVLLPNNRSLLIAVLGPDFTLQGFHNSTLEGRVLSPGEEVSPFRILDPKEGRDFEDKLRARRFEMRITYASVYGDTWLCTGTHVERLAERQENLY